MCCIACDMREWFVAIYPMGKMVTQVIYAIWSMCQMSILYLYNRAQRQIGDERRLFGAHFFVLLCTCSHAVWGWQVELVLPIF